MRIVNFKDFNKDYGKYYGLKNGEYFNIKDESEMQEILYEIYDTENFEIDYYRKIIELY
jgi:hypothetical protein